MRALFDRIHREGPVRFDVAVEAMLYGDEGFFTMGGGAGREGDFLTSPEVGPLFGVLVGRAIDAEWERLGRPDPFVVIEAGAGRGALVRAVLDAEPACLTALRYVCVERSPALRAAMDDALPLEPAANVFGAVLHGEDPDDEAAVVGGSGPVVTALDELPLVPVTGMVIANELLDNLPFRLLERRGDAWSEIFVGADGAALREVIVRAPGSIGAEATRLAPDAKDGARIPLQHVAAEWVRSALGTLQRGRVLAIDYADDTASLAGRPWTEWLRTYRAHGRGGDPLEDPGTQDVTCEVATDQLARIRRPERDRAQSEWLADLGIDDLTEAARAAWQERAHIGDLEALKHRSRVNEAAALTDPTGLGAFRVLEWVV
jgi:SAM-dependent MidA family methyltransferase